MNKQSNEKTLVLRKKTLAQLTDRELESLNVRGGLNPQPDDQPSGTP